MGGGSGDFAYLLQVLAMQRKWTYTKKKMFSVTAEVVYSIFFVRENVTLSKCLL